VGANLSETHSHPQTPFCHVSFAKKKVVTQEGMFDAVARRLGCDARGSSDGPKGAAVPEARQLASCAEGTSTHCGASSEKGRSGAREIESSHSGAPQLTLDAG